MTWLCNDPMSCSPQRPIHWDFFTLSFLAPRVCPMLGLSPGQRPPSPAACRERERPLGPGCCQCSKLGRRLQAPGAPVLPWAGAQPSWLQLKELAIEPSPGELPPAPPPSPSVPQGAAVSLPCASAAAAQLFSTSKGQNLMWWVCIYWAGRVGGSRDVGSCGDRMGPA